MPTYEKYLVIAIEWSPYEEDEEGNAIDEGTYKKTHPIFNGWPVTLEYLRVIADNTPHYIKDEVTYGIHCLDSDRIDTHNLTAFMAVQKTRIAAKGLDVEYEFTDAPAEWLEGEGFIKEVEDA